MYMTESTEVKKKIIHKKCIDAAINSFDSQVLFISTSFRVNFSQPVFVVGFI